MGPGLRPLLFRGALGGSSGVRVAPPQEEEVREQSCRPDSLRQIPPGALLTRQLPIFSAENKVHSMIICLTDGTLKEQTLKETVKEVSPDHRHQLWVPVV